jgi:hypothetical protein
VRLFELIRKRSGKTVPQFARALGYERQHWHRLESALVQGKLLQTFARAVVEAGMSGDEVLELLKEAIGEPDGGQAPPTGGRAGRVTPRVAPREDGDGADEQPATGARRTGT